MKKGLTGFFLAIVMMLAAVIGFAVWFIRKCLRVHELKLEVLQDIRKYIRYAMDGSFPYKYHDYKKPSYTSYLYTHIQLRVPCLSSFLKPLPDTLVIRLCNVKYPSTSL